MNVVKKYVPYRYRDHDCHPVRGGPTPEIKVFIFNMVFDRCHRNIRSTKQHTKYSTSNSGVKFSWITL